MSALGPWIDVQFAPLAPDMISIASASLRVMFVRPDATPTEVGDAVLGVLHHPARASPDPSPVPGVTGSRMV